jgi:hypothetical protein
VDRAICLPENSIGPRINGRAITSLTVINNDNLWTLMSTTFQPHNLP